MKDFLFPEFKIILQYFNFHYIPNRIKIHYNVCNIFCSFVLCFHLLCSIKDIPRRKNWNEISIKKILTIEDIKIFHHFVKLFFLRNKMVYFKIFWRFVIIPYWKHLMIRNVLSSQTLCLPFIQSIDTRIEIIIMQFKWIF